MKYKINYNKQKKKTKKERKNKKIILKKNKFIITNNKKKVIDEIKKYIKKSRRKNIVIGLPGGRSIKTLFNELKDLDIDWKKIHIFLIDERIVPLEHEDSNFNMLKQNLLNNLIKQKKLQEKNIHPFDIKKHDVNSYIDQFKKFKYFDIAFFGVGEDCHIGALFPNHTINRNEDYFIEINDSPKLPKNRMTLTKKLALKTKIGVFLFIGKTKENAFKKFLDKNITLEECPAKIAYKINSIILKTDE